MRMMNTRVVRTMAIVVPLAAGVVLLTAQRRRAPGEWPSYGSTNWSQYLKQLYFDALVFTAEGLRHLVAECGASQIVLVSCNRGS